MSVLFVLLPAAADVDRVFAAAAAALQRARREGRLRIYPPASDAKHLLSLVRAGRDPRATTWRRGMVWAALGGAVLGAATNGVLAGAVGMLGGLLEIAIPLGLVLGGFLGVFSAAMAGTEVARQQVRQLALSVRPGDILVQWVGDSEEVSPIAARCAAAGLPCAMI